jgi:hypothetical protein
MNDLKLPIWDFRFGQEDEPYHFRKGQFAKVKENS